MLYTDVMNTKPTVPDELIMFDRQFSWRTAWRVCRWWLAAFVISAVFDLVLPDWKIHPPLRWWVAIVFAEFTAILLFVFDAVKFIRRMDELQRRITTAALFFPVSASFFVFVLLLRLEREGFFNAVFGPPFLLFPPQRGVSQASLTLACC